MNLDYIRSFHLIAQLRSIREAAGRLQLSQPALSHQLQTLEEEFGVQLVDRHTKPLQLTEAGQELLSKCHELFEWVDTLTTQLKNVQSEIEGRLRIAAPPGIGKSWLMPRLASFMLKHPKLDVRLEFLDLSKIADRLEQYRADCVITIHEKAHPHLRFQPLFQEEMVLVCDEKHPLAKKDKWTFAQIIAAQWILFSEEDNSPEHWVQHRFGKRIPPVHAKFMVNDHSSMLELIRNGKHVAILPRHKVQGDLQHGHLIEILPSKDKAWLNQVYFGYRDRKQPPRKIAALLDYLTHTAQTH